MHLQSTPLIIGGTVLKESDDLDILVVTFDSMMTFEKHLHSVSRAASKRPGIVMKSWQVFLIDGFLEDAFGILSCSFRTTVL